MGERDRRIEEKQRELEEARQQEEKLLAEARRRAQQGGVSPPPLPTSPPPTVTPPPSTTPGTARLDMLLGNGNNGGPGVLKSGKTETPTKRVSFMPEKDNDDNVEENHPDDNDDNEGSSNKYDANANL